MLASCVPILSLTCRRCHDATFLSVFVQSFFEVRRCFRVSRSCFVPPPHVESTVLRLVPNPCTPEGCKLDPERYRSFLRACFSSKNQVLSKVFARKDVWNRLVVAGDCAVRAMNQSVDTANPSIKRDNHSITSAIHHSPTTKTTHHPINLNRRPWELDWRDYCTLYSA